MSFIKQKFLLSMFDYKLSNIDKIFWYLLVCFLYFSQKISSSLLQGVCTKWNMPWKLSVMLVHAQVFQQRMASFWQQRNGTPTSFWMREIPQRKFTNYMSKLLFYLEPVYDQNYKKRLQHCLDNSISCAVFRLLAQERESHYDSSLIQHLFEGLP